MCLKAFCGEVVGMSSSKLRRLESTCSRSTSTSKPHVFHKGLAHDNSKSRDTASNWTCKRFIATKLALIRKERKEPDMLRSSVMLWVKGNPSAIDVPAASKRPFKTGLMHGKCTAASGVSNQACKTTMSAVTTMPPQRWALMLVKSTPCHKLAPAVKPLDAAETTKVDATEAMLLVALMALTAAMDVASPKSATAPKTLATWWIGPCCPDKRAPKIKTDRPEKVFKSQAEDFHKRLTKDGLLGRARLV